MTSGFDNGGTGSGDWEAGEPFGAATGDVPPHGAAVTGIDPLGAPANGDPASSSARSGLFESGHDRGGIVAARGTGEGLVLRLDGRVDPAGLRSAVNDFMNSRRAFLSGQEVIIEWVGQMPEAVFVSELMTTLVDDFSVTVKASRVLDRQRNARTQSFDSHVISHSSAGEFSESSAGTSTPRIFRKSAFEGPEENMLSDRPTSLFDGVHAMSRDSQASAATGSRNHAASHDPMLWDDPDARILYTTLRSGQKIESEHSIVIIGDVNSGAEVIAGGDIIVLGTLRGVAHAGAYDETGGGRAIFALNLQPTQLRIGMVISRGAPEGSMRNQPEIARVDGTLIVVEPFSSKGLGWRRGARLGQ